MDEAGDSIIQLFDALAVSYDAWYITPAGRFADRVEKRAVLSLLEPVAGTKALDIGCGTGNYSFLLAELGLKVTGLDISPAMLAMAREKLSRTGPGPSFVCGDAAALPFAGNTFDIVLSVSALEFMPDPAAVLKEGWRVLRPGGRMVVGLLGRDSSWGNYYKEKARRDPGSIFNKARLYTLPELVSAMPGELLQAKEVLFTPPDFDYDDEQKAMEAENAAIMEGLGGGGFICAASLKK